MRRLLARERARLLGMCHCRDWSEPVRPAERLPQPCWVPSREAGLEQAKPLELARFRSRELAQRRELVPQPQRRGAPMREEQPGREQPPGRGQVQPRGLAGRWVPLTKPRSLSARRVEKPRLDYQLHQRGAGVADPRQPGTRALSWASDRSPDPCLRAMEAIRRQPRQQSPGRRPSLGRRWHLSHWGQSPKLFGRGEVGVHQDSSRQTEQPWQRLGQVAEQTDLVWAHSRVWLQGRKSSRAWNHPQEAVAEQRRTRRPIAAAMG